MRQRLRKLPLCCCGFGFKRRFVHFANFLGGGGQRGYTWGSVGIRRVFRRRQGFTRTRHGAKGLGFRDLGLGAQS